MTASNPRAHKGDETGVISGWGVLWFVAANLAAMAYFAEGIDSLVDAWSTPEYSHGPLIPLVSAFLFLKQLKQLPAASAAVQDRRPGIVVLVAALALGGIGRLLQVSDFVAYAMIAWAGGMVLLCLGWRRGREFWPPVLHLVYMLPLPGVLFYTLSTWLQGISSEMGAWFLQLLGVPVFLDGNIIDLGVYKLHVAEACSGLRYLFPILSFSYIFAVLYRGPTWHKAVLLLSAAPITVLMNSVRIALAGVVVQRWGLDYVEGLTHFFEGWVIFLVCVVLLFALARVLLLLHPERPGLAVALDLDTRGLGAQLARLRLVEPSPALLGVAVGTALWAVTWQAIPERLPAAVPRETFAQFPDQLGSWRSGPAQALDAETERILAADDYRLATYVSTGTAAPVELFMVWYKDQMTGGTHSPTVCLPGAGWEIASFDRIEADSFGETGDFTLNRAVIQKGVDRMLVYYWYEQQGLRTASSFRARFDMAMSKVRSGRSDGALIRLITPILPGESDAAAEERLRTMMPAVLEPLSRFVPGR